MKNQTAAVLVSLLYFIIYQPLFAQEKINLSTSIGFPELLNIGVRYSFPQTQLGISLGTMPIPDETNLAISGDAFFHIGGSSELSSRRPWYVRTGLTYNKMETKYQRLTYFYFNPRIGREINLSRKIGFQVDLGGAFILFKETENKDSPNINLDMTYSVLPSFNAGFFYRL